MTTTTKPATAKKPADRQPKKQKKAKAVPVTEQLGDDVRLQFTVGKQTYTSIPFMEAATNVGVVEAFPNPEELLDYERARYLVKVILTAYRDDPTAQAELRKMSMAQLEQILDEAAEEEDLDLGESSGSSD